MDLTNLLTSLNPCPCGRTHSFDTRLVLARAGLTRDAGNILREQDFPRQLLLVADENTLAASAGLEQSLENAGFSLRKQVYGDLNTATDREVEEVSALLGPEEGLISVGSGSLNDVCRVAAYRKGRPLALFATAPSMDGFASDTAPIVKQGFKSSWQAAQPAVILADTEILAAAPDELKAAGFGDMMAKYIALADWRISALLTGEYYCDGIAALTRRGVEEIGALADGVCARDPETAGSIFRALVMTGLAMKLAGCSRPASGAEHVLAHYWECRKLEQGLFPEFHGKKVGVATLLMTRLYRRIARRCEHVSARPDPTDWQRVYAVYGPLLRPDVEKLNTPTITDTISPERLEECWPEIRRIILETVPEEHTLLDLFRRAGAATEPEEVHVDAALLAEGLRYHPYMRRRVLLTRLLPMLGIDPVEELGL